MYVCMYVFMYVCMFNVCIYVCMYDYNLLCMLYMGQGWKVNLTEQLKSIKSDFELIACKNMVGLWLGKIKCMYCMFCMYV